MLYNWGKIWKFCKLNFFVLLYPNNWSLINFGGEFCWKFWWCFVVSVFLGFFWKKGLYKFWLINRHMLLPAKLFFTLLFCSNHSKLFWSCCLDFSFTELIACLVTCVGSILGSQTPTLYWTVKSTNSWIHNIYAIGGRTIVF